ncbi:hypothetical protein HBH92_245510 [Parastagonospora nodorum]|nr:hypothetical protein HBH51_235760 [Parastagonospora nodorum]KAH4399826.1 hypothetical protein HBH92_245510 [Parastagonospora nodorum]KAH4481508.1 hypothetical protein HBH89_248340 [Parastagonospora nodorum]KAH4522732.1 hypothetical protein HBH86_247150 [Parastagonospora nodorum]KAH4537628.1 hypothetical protein HBH85_144730 [Parastagonospora nodorum]
MHINKLLLCFCSALIKNLKNAYTTYINLFITKIIALYNYAIDNITSKYTNKRNKLIDKIYKYITSYNKLSSKIGSNRKLLLTNLTSLKVFAY